MNRSSTVVNISMRERREQNTGRGKERDRGGRVKEVVKETDDWNRKRD